MKLDLIYNGDCLQYIPELDDKSIDIVVTSPPYNTSKKQDQSIIEKKKAEGKLEAGYKQHSSRYDVFQDQKTDEEYAEWVSSIFNSIDPKLKSNGVICWNFSYGVGDTGKINQAVWLSVLKIIENTQFQVCEYLAWKKPCTTVLNTNNDLTRICEIVLVFCRKSEYKSYYLNKNKIKLGACPTYQKQENFIKTRKCNDETNPFNFATYTSELVERLLLLYCPPKGTVFDPFMGTGTTAVAAVECGCNYIGTELSENQCKWANNRIKKLKKNSLWF